MFFRRQPCLDLIGHPLLQVAGELEQGFFGDLAFVNIDQHAGETKCLALLIEFAATAGEHPEVTAVGALDPVLDVVGFASLDRQRGPFLNPATVVRMDPPFDDLLRQVAQVLPGWIRERASESLITRQHVGLDVPDKGTEQGTGVQCQAYPLVIRTISVFSHLSALLGYHPLRGFHHHGHDPGGTSVIVSHRAVVEVHPDIFRNPVTQQHQFFVAIGQGAARQAGVDHVAIEFGDLGPTQFHGGAEQVRMTPTGKLGISVVIDHVPGLAPEHHHRQWGREHQLHRAAQAPGP
ncbi:hypothetical protein D3C86_1154340 [compost metagenome]